MAGPVKAVAAVAALAGAAVLGAWQWRRGQPSGANLLRAVQAGDAAEAHRLLAAGAPANASSRSGDTALAQAAGRGDLVMTLVLLEHGADPDARAPSVHGPSALHRAAAAGHEDVCMALLDAGAFADPADRLLSARLARLTRSWRGKKPAVRAPAAAAAAPAGVQRRRPRAAPAPAPPASCPICFSEPPNFRLEGCGCAACFACMRQHAAAELRQGQQPRCPLCLAAAGTSAAGAARGRISRRQLELLLGEADLLILDRRQLEALGVRSCPHCRAGVELGPGADLLRAACPACRRPLHVGDAAADAAFAAYRRQQRLGACPKCGATVEKTAGCNRIKCRCGAEFCYRCGKDTSNTNYIHWRSSQCPLFDK